MATAKKNKKNKAVKKAKAKKTAKKKKPTSNKKAVKKKSGAKPAKKKKSANKKSVGTKAGKSGKATKKAAKSGSKKASVKNKSANKAAKAKPVKSSSAKKQGKAKTTKVKKTFHVDLEGLFTPLDDRLIIQPEGVSNQTAGGIIIPDSASTERPTRGTVLAVGRGHLNTKGKIKPMDVKAGDAVIYSAYAGNSIFMGETEVLVLRENDVLGILD